MLVSSINGTKANSLNNNWVNNGDPIAAAHFDAAPKVVSGNMQVSFTIDIDANGNAMYVKKMKKSKKSVDPGQMYVFGIKPQVETTSAGSITVKFQPAENGYQYYLLVYSANNVEPKVVDPNSISIKDDSFILVYAKSLTKK